MLRKDFETRLLEAALDQRSPSPALVRALQKALTNINHPDRERARDYVRAGGV